MTENTTQIKQIDAFALTIDEQLYLDNCLQWLNKIYKGHASFPTIEALIASYNVFTIQHTTREKATKLAFAIEGDNRFNNYLARQSDETFPEDFTTAHLNDEE